MNAGQHLGNTKAILEKIDWFTDYQKLKYIQVLNWSPDYLSLIDIVGKFVFIGLVDYIPMILPFLGKPTFNFFSMKKKIDFFCTNTIALSKPKIYHEFHFDSLSTTDSIIKYWAWLEEISKNWLEEVDTQKDDRIKQHMLVSLLAQSLHAVQDFYSHSNWIEILNENFGYVKVDDFPSWFDIFKTNGPEYASLKAEISKINFTTGYFPIGKDLKISEIYHNDKKRLQRPGLNKDRAERPYFDVVYFLSFKNGVQWLNYLKENFLTIKQLEIINDPLENSYVILANIIQPYIKKIAFKLREWNGSGPFSTISLKIKEVYSFHDNLYFSVLLSTSENLIKYDRDFRKSFVNFFIMTDNHILKSFQRFGKKSGLTNYKLHLTGLANLQNKHELYLKVKYGLFIDEKMIIKKN